MSQSWCPYCNSVKSILLGNVYCSLQKKSMGDLETGTLYIRSPKLEETCEHVSRLSIRCMLTGEQHYKVGNNHHLVTPKNYLVVNQGQHYQTSFNAATEQEMMLVAFKPGFAEDVHRTYTSTLTGLLDSPFSSANGPLHFFEHTFPADPVISAIFQRLRKFIDIPLHQKSGIHLDVLYTQLLERLLFLQYGLHTEIDALQSVKKSTRIELYKRLHIAHDYMEAHASEKIRLEDIARVACLSVHHFKREFKNLFGISPHQFLLQKRMDRAKIQLHTTATHVADISRHAGFENISAFGRAFKKSTGYSPLQYRSLKN